MFQRRNSSSMLDLEAANYFELDPSQIHLLNMPTTYPKSSDIISTTNKRIISGDRFSIKAKDEQSDMKQARAQVNSTTPTRGNTSRRPVHHHHQHQHQHQHYQVSGKFSKVKSNEKENQHQAIRGQQQMMVMSKKPSTSILSLPYNSNNNNINRNRTSPSTSTCSLPSVSSSPSLSPSLVCPHLSLDDILSRNTDDRRHQSAHTIGLCDKCLRHPPPDIHSPLSPAFRPSTVSSKGYHHHHHHQVPSNHLSSSSSQLSQLQPNYYEQTKTLKRGYSDLQGRSTTTKHGARNRRFNLPQDDSLDYYLEPGDLKRLQMSPTIRNSVGYIRNNPTEAGRVIRVFKNGHPFDKPLRICIMRGEFANLNHLLDYINSRQLVPSGARYLFHLDGQLVYSEHELKHGSCYVVSGTRNYDFKVNRVLKEQQMQLLAKQTVSSVHYQPQYRVEYDKVTQKEIGKELSVKTKTSPSKVVVANLSTNQRIDQRQTGQEQLLVTSNKKGIIKSKPEASRVKPDSNQQRSAVKKTFASKQQVASSIPSADAKKITTKGSPRNRDVIVKSNESLNFVSKYEQPPKSVVRAKSELSALPGNKRKKNVTFVDTGRGSSPAISLNSEIVATSSVDHPVEQVKETLVKELETNEVGIQVSDSIEGFLIDLPIALPADTVKSKKDSLRNKSNDVQQKKSIAGQTRRKQGGKVVTITERQLSFDEIGKLKDMDAGDHHNENHKIQHVSIRLDSFDNPEGAPIEMLSAKEPVEVLVPDRSNTINIGQEPGTTEQPLDQATTSSDQWQYPVDSEQQQRPGTKSATPTERPVSQSEANETVHARVTTPSPSLSTMGDSTSLNMSYDYYQHSDETSALAMANLPDKQRVPVIGTLHRGLNPPIKNFKLVWVNGFIINDQYPENSIAAANLITAPTRNDAKSPVTGLLSPSDANNQQQRSSQSQASIQFKPSDRFHNWVCHSHRHDELIYPAGSLVILWCRWTNEQRYYSRHTSNVSAITLASLDHDLAASAQVGDSTEKTNNPSIHLWSLTTLETLRIIEDDNFRSKHIYSLKVRNSDLDGCELSVCAREEKRIWFYVLFLKLLDATQKSKQSPKRAGTVVSIKANKPLQANQIPFVLIRLSNVRGGPEESVPLPVGSKGSPRRSSISTPTTKSDLLGNVLVSFGRRHFQVWYVDRKRQNLLPMQAVNKSSYFIETMVRASCFARMSPSELLIGDSTGNVALLIVQIHQSSDSKSLIGSPSRTSATYRYSLETWPLLDPNSAINSNASITCLTRISGSLFAAADSNCAIRFFKIIRSTTKTNRKNSQEQETLMKVVDQSGKSEIKCQQVACIRLPKDLGYVCSIILSKYSRKQPAVVEFYAISTSNAILFGTVQLQTSVGSSSGDSSGKDKAPMSCNVSVIHEGHESPAMSLVADTLPDSGRRQTKVDELKPPKQVGDYFTCSLDCKICKWSGKQLVWKSMLPSACASLAVHPIGFVLAIGSADGTVYILDKFSGLLISYFPLTPVCINCLAYSRDGTLLAAGCANGSIFILPVYERGLKYKKVSILQSPYPVVSLQFSVSNKYILTSITHGSYQELILWDLPNFRYMRNNVKLAANKIEWFDAICSGSEDVRAIWENANLDTTSNADPIALGTARSKYQARRLSLSGQSDPIHTNTIVNLSCHRLIRNKQHSDDFENFVIASDTRGHLRLFSYPCSDIQHGFYEVRVGSSPVSCCRFLALRDSATINDAMFVSSSLDGSICLWSLI